MDTPTASAAPFTVAGLLKLRAWTQYSLGLLLDHVATIPWDRLLVELEGFGYPTLRWQLSHSSGSEAFWLHLLLRRPWPGWDEYRSAPDMATLRASFDESYALVREYLSGIDDAELGRPRELVFPDGGRGDFSPALVLNHAITHLFHHKGQAVAMCRLLGYPAPETDLDANYGRE